MFQPVEIACEPGLFGNRSKRASKNRWCDGNLVRFTDGVPAQVGGWVEAPVVGSTITGRAREIISWRPSSVSGRLCAIGTHSNAYEFDGGAVSDITPTGFVVGRPDSIIGAGYGAGLYGDDLYGTPRVTSANTLEASSWTFDMFGEVLVGCFNADGIIYDYLAGTDPRLEAVAVAPTANAILVTDERHVLAIGADGQGNLVKWSDREDYTSVGSWTPSATNRAGSYEFQVTSPLVCGKRCRGLNLIWSNTELFAMSPLNNALVYSSDTIASRCGVMGPHAACVVTDTGGEVAIWMGPDAFFIYDGLVRNLPCDLQDYVFKDINMVQRAKIQARSNSLHDEIWFYYVSDSSTEIDRAVTYNYINNTWSKATISRLTWLDQKIFPLPLAIDSAGTIYEHENGNLADGVPMDSYVVSYPLVQGNGRNELQLEAFWPDLEPLSDTCAVTFIGRDYPGGPDIVFGPYNFDVTDEKVDLEIDVREVQMKIAGVDGGWELGLPTISMQIGGER
jgi:hypothetical protein